MKNCDRKIGFIFSGQGCQKVGMFADIAEKYPQFRQTFAEASEILGYDVWDIMQHHTRKVHDTRYTQPLLFCSEIALYRLIEQQRPDLLPSVISGHSLGEIVAWTVAKTLDFTTALTVVEQRALLMKELLNNQSLGMVAIVGLDYLSVDDICYNANETEFACCEVVAINAPLQIVVGGPLKGLESIIEAAKIMGAKKTTRLKISTLSHHPFLQPISAKFDDYLRKIPFIEPQKRVVNNVQALIETIPQVIKEQLSNQLYRPVQWVRVIERMVREGVKEFYEIGYGSTLSSLNKRIYPKLPACSLGSCDALERFLTQ